MSSSIYCYCSLSMTSLFTLLHGIKNAPPAFSQGCISIHGSTLFFHSKPRNGRGSGTALPPSGSGAGSGQRIPGAASSLGRPSLCGLCAPRAPSKPLTRPDCIIPGRFCQSPKCGLFGEILTKCCGKRRGVHPSSSFRQASTSLSSDQAALAGLVEGSTTAGRPVSGRV